MSKARKKKTSKASQSAASALKGSAARPEPAVKVTVVSRRPRPAFLDRPVGPGMRITWRAIFLFLLGCAVLDGILYLIFRLGFSSCYGILCLMG